MNFVIGVSPAIRKLITPRTSSQLQSFCEIRSYSFQLAPTFASIPSRTFCIVSDRHRAQSIRRLCYREEAMGSR